MWQALFWCYLVNAVLLIDHEIDSAYWKEWELFRLPGGIGGFLLLHLPLLAVVLYGLVLVERRSTAGLVLSLVVAGGGVFAFTVHNYFIVVKKRSEFDTLASRALLVATLLVSLAQGVIAALLLAWGS